MKRTWLFGFPMVVCSLTIGLKKLLDLSIASSRSIAVFDDPGCVMPSAIENRHAALEAPLQIDGSSYCGSSRDFLVKGGRREAVWEAVEKRITDLPRTPFADMDSLLGSDDLVKAIISFGSEKDINWVEHRVCLVVALMCSGLVTVTSVRCTALTSRMYI